MHLTSKSTYLSRESVGFVPPEKHKVVQGLPGLKTETSGVNSERWVQRCGCASTVDGR